MRWQDLTVAPEGTHHLRDGRPIYEERFDGVLKFHAPGLAPVVQDGLAWHIRPDGTPAYARRFLRTFGFYQGVAAVESSDGWHHIHPDGTDLSVARFDWCGNFQESRCAVRGRDGTYFHITDAGVPAYARRWRYAGDYRDGAAVVQAEDGRSTHIDLEGAFLHGRWFLDLDVFHKGFARARDPRGWTHVDRNGRPVYRRRFAAVEPFYNGQARVERFDGGLEVIDEQGRTVRILRHTTPGPTWSDHRIGGWLVGPELHRGSSGAVYVSAPDAVIKSTSDLSAWAREAEILSLLDGRGAPRLLDAFTRSGTGYLVLERIHGHVLGKRNRATPRSPRQAVPLVLDLLRPLARMHGAGWVHSDIHPENVLVREGHAILLDPARAVRLGPRGTWDGEVHWGRWEFIPPEQFEGFTTLDPSADTYATCALLVYLVTGRGPFRRDLESAQRADWSAVRASFIESRRCPMIQSVPEPLQTIVARGLALNRNERYPDAGTLIHVLEV